MYLKILIRLFMFNKVHWRGTINFINIILHFPGFVRRISLLNYSREL